MVATVDKAIEIAKHIEEKKTFFELKAERARAEQKREEYWTRYKLYRDFFSRAYNLIFTLRNPKRFGEAKFKFLKLTPEEYRKKEEERVAKGKEKFERLHTYSPWFLGTSLDHDYGCFKCSKCQREFYHSPSKISRAGKVVFSCACGYCTNEIIIRDYNCKAPFC